MAFCESSSFDPTGTIGFQSFGCLEDNSMHKRVLIAAVCVACATASAPLMMESDEDVLMTLADVRNLGFEPDGRIEESLDRTNPTPTTVRLEYEAIGKKRGGGPISLILFSFA
jgi:hypothetical protein